MQTITQVVPHLASSLRARKQSLLAGVADLLLSFTAAFLHIPPNRRRSLFAQLATTLGAKEALPAITALLADRYPDSTRQQAFLPELLAEFDLRTVLQVRARTLIIVVSLTGRLCTAISASSTMACRPSAPSRTCCLHSKTGAPATRRMLWSTSWRRLRG